MLTFMTWALFHLEPSVGLLGVAAAEVLAMSYALAIAIERWVFRAQ